MRWIVLAVITVSPLAMAAEINWADSKQHITQRPEYAETQKICAQLRNIKPPASDKPTREQAEKLKGCSSNELYYGYHQAPDPEQARLCAFVEHEQGKNGFFAGTGMLMTIYANGKGAKRNLDLATTYACRVDGRSTESIQRVEYLQGLKTQEPHKRDFNACVGITFGLSGRSCAAHATMNEDVARNHNLRWMQRNWSPAQQAAFQRLIQRQEAYAKVASYNEVDQTGTARAHMVVHQEQRLKNSFYEMLYRLNHGKGIPAAVHPYRYNERMMNDNYRKVMALDGKVYGTITLEGVRKTQRAWLPYRDAWVEFAKQRYPSIPTERIRAWVTQKRGYLLGKFAEKGKRFERIREKIRAKREERAGTG